MVNDDLDLDCRDILRINPIWFWFQIAERSQEEELTVIVSGCFKLCRRMWKNELSLMECQIAKKHPSLLKGLGHLQQRECFCGRQFSLMQRNSCCYYYLRTTRSQKIIWENTYRIKNRISACGSKQQKLTNKGKV